MKLVPAKCPNCGANINVDEEQETTKCEYCGDAILIDKAIQKYQIDINVTNVPTLDNYLVLAERSYSQGNYNEAYEYYGDAIRLDPNNYQLVLRHAISAALKSDCMEMSLQNLNSAIINSTKLVNKDKSKYEIIISESLECVIEIESRLFKYCDNKISLDEAIAIRNMSTDILTIIENLLSVGKQTDNKELRCKILSNAIIFAEFVVKPKIYVSQNKKGSKIKKSLKIDRKELKGIYDFWNDCINEYNGMNDSKIKNKKMPLIQLDKMQKETIIFSAFFIILLIISMLRK